MNIFRHYESFEFIEKEKEYAKDVIGGLSDEMKSMGLEKRRFRTFNVTGCFNGTESNLIKSMLQQEGAEVCIGLLDGAAGILSCMKKENELIELYKNKKINSEAFSETASRLLSNMNEAEGCSRYLIYGWELKLIEEGRNIGKGIKSGEMKNALNKTDYNKNDMALICAEQNADKSLLNIYRNMILVAENGWCL